MNNLIFGRFFFEFYPNCFQPTNKEKFLPPLVFTINISQTNISRNKHFIQKPTHVQ